MNSHTVPVFEFDFSKVEKHPEADKLGLFKIPNTDYNYVLNLDCWRDKKCLVAWFQPDTLVDVNLPYFKDFVKNAKYGEAKNLYRFRVAKLRNRISYGFLMELPSDCTLKDGENAAEYFKTQHYNPEDESKNGEVGKSPSGVYFTYDLHSFLGYARKSFVKDELCLLTEKLEGTSARYVFKDEMHCGSRTEWKSEYSSVPKITVEELFEKVRDIEKAKNIYQKRVVEFKPKKNLYWDVYQNTSGLHNFCKDNPGFCVYGEIVGGVGGFKYGFTSDKCKFFAFDILKPDSTWMEVKEFMETCTNYEIPTVPVLGIFPFDFDDIVKRADDMYSCLCPTQIAEGICVRPIKERWNDAIGRVHLKIKNPTYLEKSK